MLNCRWLLCLVLIIGLTTHEAVSMNEQPREKNEKNKPQNGSPVKEGDQSSSSSPATPLTRNAINSNVSIALVPDTHASTSANSSKLISHEQSRSKRHFHRSKLYRKETRSKPRPSLTKSNVANGNLNLFGADHSVISTQDPLSRNSDTNSDSRKLEIESLTKTSGTSPPKNHSVTSYIHDDSTPTHSTSKSLFMNGSKNAYAKKFDKLSSGVTVSSENWDNSSSYSSSSSSESGSAIDEKSSSIELMAFTFENVEDIGRIERSTFSNEVMKRVVENSTGSPSIAIDHSSSTPMGNVETSDKSIDRSKSTSGDLSHGVIDRDESLRGSKNDGDEDVIIYSVHTGTSRDMDRVSKNDSASITSESSVSKISRDTSTKEVGEIDNESNSTNSKNISKPVRPDIDEYSWVSVNDSLNRVSLNELVDTLKNIDSRGTRGSYSYSNSTLFQGTSTLSNSKLDIADSSPSISAEYHRSFTFSDNSQSSEKMRSTSQDPDVKLADHYPDVDRPLKLTIPLNIDAIIKADTKNHILVDGVKVPGSSTSADSSSEKKSLDQNIPNPSSSRCSPDSSTRRNINDRNPFYQRQSVSGKNISESEQCLTRRSSGQALLINSLHELNRPVETLASNSEELEVGVLLPANESHREEIRVPKSSESENEGGQSFVSSGFIVLEDLEPVLRDLSASEESVVSSEVDSTTTRNGHFFEAFADLEEHCNASSFNVFIPSINSREIIATDEPGEEKGEMFNSSITTPEDSLYIIEGFGFLKNSPDELSEIDDEFDRRRDAAFDYSETEIYPGYPQLGEQLPPAKFIDQIEFEVAGLPIKSDSIIPADLQWRGNVGDRNDDPWWLNDEYKRKIGQAVKKIKDDDAEERTVLIPSVISTPQEFHAISSPNINESKIGGYRIILLPTAYVLIGICIILVGCSIWCSRISVRRQPNLPKLTYFIKERQVGRAAEAVV